jgi:hypothetical protein
MNESAEEFLRRMSANVGRGTRRSKARKRQRFLKRWVYDSVELHGNKMKTESSDIFLGAHDITDYITSQIVLDRSEQGLSTIHKEFTILVEPQTWNIELSSISASEDNRLIQATDSHGLVIVGKTSSYFSYNLQSSSVIIKLYGDQSFVYEWYDYLTDKYEEVKNVIEWIYSADGNSIEIPVRGDREPVEEMYPFLNGKTLNEYYDEFMSSSASILLLIGPPGTGKTTFIRGLLQHAQISAIVTYDAAILSKDYLFAQFIEGDRNVMIVEDADNFLGLRSDGNDMMHKFLNVGDGLVTTKNKKMIFSTNLPSIRDVDPALIRPGRCFDILSFDLLNEEQATKLSLRLGIEYDNKYDTKPDGKYSIADIFHKQTEAPKTPKRKVGFI